MDVGSFAAGVITAIVLVCLGYWLGDREKYPQVDGAVEYVVDRDLPREVRN